MTSQERRIYFEQQEGSLCGVHCVNSLLQGPRVSELELVNAGIALNEEEEALLNKDELSKQRSGNLSAEGGFFNISVLHRILGRYNLSAVPFKQPNKCIHVSDQENALILNKDSHWFTVRKIDGHWWNLNSVNAAPEHIGTEPTDHIKTLLGEHGSVFSVHGHLPELAPPRSFKDQRGVYFTAEEAKSRMKEAAKVRTRSRSVAAIETLLARGQRRKSVKLRGGKESEDEALKRAIKNSLKDEQQEGASDDLERAIWHSLQ